MYVCVCRAINEQQLRQLVREGAGSVRAVNQCCGLGGRCGRCVPYARAVIADECAHSATPDLGSTSEAPGTARKIVPAAAAPATPMPVGVSLSAG
ncbi:MAG: (2Fe-2S)-binding protein [Sinobacteraceae bacterium]|nr:(2Fe-2S)-binding protein [Nevskiaceae bacterium]